ncbi:MAG: histidine--tRNA ligase [Planctomycetes bacterium]|nr:histidine--tRNA ligase [Planctomycetota bacterium]
MSLIEPRTLKGFRDYLPSAMVPREHLIDTARKVYKSYGFLPIDTPALEYEEILTGKGGDESDKQLYRFEDSGGRKVALRFDLTVPLARFVAQHSHELGLPFKRYHIATVWRGENTQRGRYREFMQCDFDTIGSESIACDVETALVIHDLLQAIGFDDFKIHVNNRRLLTGLLERLDLEGRSGAVLRALDKLPKIGPEKVAEEMATSAGVSAAQAREILTLASVSGTNDAMLAQLEPLVASSERGRDGLGKLATLLGSARAAGVSDKRLQLDVSIARGLDYYTGTVFETFLGALPTIGSVCSGGRYDDLASLYTKERLPGIGASLGLDRLLAAMEELKLLPEKPAVAPVFLPYFTESRLTDYFKLAARLRQSGLGVEFYPEAKKLGNQLKYADRRGFRFALVVGDSEWEAGRGQVKDLKTGSSASVPLETNGAVSAELLAALTASH